MYQGKAEKRYVDVIYHTSLEGTVTPLEIDWADGRRFSVERVSERRRAHSLKVGGTGIRYTIRVRGRWTYLYYDDYRRRWFVEAKVE